VTGEIWHGGEVELNRLRKRIADEIRQEILVSPLVDLVEPASLHQGEGKALRVLDKRQQTMGS
jgi:phenylacetate-coenzyme A ligase PaaK-like adenylate-forming protein